MVYCVERFLEMNENSTVKMTFVHIRLNLLTMSNMGCSVEFFSLNPYCEEHKIPSSSIKEFILVYISFSKILLKLDNKEIGL